MCQDYSREESCEYQMKIDLLSFDGHLHVEDFLDLVMEVERFFEYISIPEDRKVKLVAYKFKEGASAWWEQLQISRARQGKGFLTSGLKINRLLKVRFLPLDFDQLLLKLYKECQLGVQTIQIYVDDFYRLFAENDLNNTKALPVARFLERMRLQSKDRVSMHHVFTLT
jgi:hypothetical protein